MDSFKSWKSFRDFSNIVKNQNRYIYNDFVSNFLKIVAETSKNRKEYVNKDVLLWRAQRGCSTKIITDERGNKLEISHPYYSDRMTPLLGEATEGRANPKGIPYLYLSNDKDTALAEVRPSLDSYISLGEFKLTEDIKILNCSNDFDSVLYYFEEPSNEKKEKKVWSDINDAFSKPVSRSDRRADYIPTQIIAELFKDIGFDGVAYKSSYGKKANIVLFDIDVVKLLRCHLFEVENINFNFKEAGNPYYCNNK